MCDCVRVSVRVCLMYLLQLLLFANIIFCSMQSPRSWYFSEELRSSLNSAGLYLCLDIFVLHVYTCTYVHISICIQHVC